MFKSLLLEVLLLFGFTVLFFVIAILTNHSNPMESVYNIFATIGMLHWIEDKVLKGLWLNLFY